MTSTVVVVALLLSAPNALAQKEDVTERYSVEFEAGFPTDYDDTPMWENGYDAGITVFTGVENFETNESDVGVSARVGAGLSHAVSSSSWIDMIPSFRATFAGQDTWQFAVSIGFRVRV
jgi:hypothetical protein